MSILLKRAILEGLSKSYVFRLFDLASPNLGVIIALHRVKPRQADLVSELTRGLEVTPEYLEEFIKYLIKHDVSFLSLGEISEFTKKKAQKRRFACFTIDDGYKDNLEFALPIFLEYQIPFAIYVSTAFPDRRGSLWWFDLAHIVSQAAVVETHCGDKERVFALKSIADRQSVYRKLVKTFRYDVDDAGSCLNDLYQQTGVPRRNFVEEICLSWNEIRALSESDLVTIGAHTIHHPNLTNLPESRVLAEIIGSVDRIAEEIGDLPRHFAYPFGDSRSASAREFKLVRALGFHTAVTTKPGYIYRRSLARREALPRISLHGNYSHPRYMSVLGGVGR